MVETTRCQECGVPLDEIPFDECDTHRAHFAAEDTESVCVNAHDLCYGGAGGPCPYCETRPIVAQQQGGGDYSDEQDPAGRIAAALAYTH